MNRAALTRRDQTGLIGKMILIWLVLVAVVGIAAIDTVSIAFTKFHLSDVASSAATTGANTWRSSHDPQRACDSARQSVTADDPEATVPRNGCVVNEQTGEVTVTVRKSAPTMVAARLPWTKRFAKPEAIATSGPSVL